MTEISMWCLQIRCTCICTGIKRCLCTHPPPHPPFFLSLRVLTDQKRYGVCLCFRPSLARLLSGIAPTSIRPFWITPFSILLVLEPPTHSPTHPIQQSTRPTFGQTTHHRTNHSPHAPRRPLTVFHGLLRCSRRLQVSSKDKSSNHSRRAAHWPRTCEYRFLFLCVQAASQPHSGHQPQDGQSITPSARNVTAQR